jgi:hypothetical protein
VGFYSQTTLAAIKGMPPRKLDVKELQKLLKSQYAELRIYT